MNQLAPGWIWGIIVEHIYMNRFVAGHDLLGYKTKPQEVVEVRNFMFTIKDIYTSKPTKSTMLITNMKEFLGYLVEQNNCDMKYD